MNSGQVDQYRQKLLETERELSSALSRAGAEVAEQDELATQDYGDKATSTYTKDSLLQQRGQQSEQLVAIQDSLRRIQDGTYGVCTECGEPIAAKRLEAMPWAGLCMACQNLQDDLQGTGGAPSRSTL